jgi:hypothetical protein
MGDPRVNILKSGWLWRARDSQPRHNWKRCWVWLTKDRLCYTYDPRKAVSVKYIPLDDVSPSNHTAGPQITTCTGTSPSESDEFRAGCVFMLDCRQKLHFFAADTAANAEVLY